MKPLEAEEKSAGGIILPEAAQQRPREGRLVALGTTPLYIDTEKEKGEVIIHASFGGTEVKIEGDDYLIVNEDAILAVQEE